MDMTLTPAPGTDYESKTEAIEALNGEQHFINEEGVRVDRWVLEADKVTEVRIRYHGLSRMVILVHAEGGSWVMP